VRIAFVAPLVTPIREPQLGGSQVIVADVAAGLTARGHAVDVFAASGSCIKGARVIDTGVDPAALQSSLFRVDGSSGATDASREAFAKTYELVRDGDYDVVHNHAFDAPAVELASGLPAVHTLHLGPQEDIARAVNEMGAKVVCVSESQRTLWERHVSVSGVVRNGVPVERIPFSAEPGQAALYAGRLSPEKGTAEAIEIARGAGVDVVVVGHGYDPDYAASLRSRYPDVDFRDALPRPALWELMAASSALLCPIAWDEPFGLTAAEAQAAGTPVIGFGRGALPEVVADGATGALVGSVAQATDALRGVDRFERAACRRHAEKHLSLRAALDAHEKLYAS
jgi:glycosyltransferase involved in cell wall biosynthesis